MRQNVIRASAILPALQHGRDPFPHLPPGATIAIWLGTIDLEDFYNAFSSLGYTWQSKQDVQVNGSVTELHLWRRGGGSTLHHEA